ncbi:MAG: tetratricopeptide repeat protein [Gammaproteobacteria bacterium]
MKLNLKSKKFLIVEDHAAMRKAIREMLYTLAAELITEASTGLNAIAAMEKEKFDIVLCDYNLGVGKNGQQVLEEAKFRRLLPAHTIFIMVTAEQNQNMVLGAMESKPDEYLTKPFNAQQLLLRLQRNFERKQQLAKIEQALAANNLSLAIRLCDEKLGEDNRKMQSQFLKLRAELAINAGDFNKASRIYQEILEQRELYWARLGLGVIDYLQNQFDAAIKIFEQVIESHPMILEAYDWLARAHEARGDFQTAQQTLKQATELSPHAILRQKKLASIADKTGQLEVAEHAYKSAVSLGKYSVHKSSKDFLGLAKIYSKTNADQAALKTLKEMRSEYINDPEAELRAATLESEVYQKIGNESLSKQAYETAKKLSQQLGDKAPNDVKLDFARACYLKGDNETADHLVKQLLSNNIDEEHFVDDVRHMMRNANQDEHMEALIQSIKQTMIEINNKGVELYKQGHFAEALHVFEEAVATMPENKTIIINTVKILLYDLKTTGFDINKFQQAQAFLKKAAALYVNPDKIGYLQMQLEKLSHAANAKS